MAETYPAEVATFKVVGRLVRGVADRGDEGQAPDLIPIQNATITFTPDLQPPSFAIPNAQPPLTVFLDSIIATTDSNGYLKIAEDADLGVVLPYGMDTDIVPHGWTWTITINVGGNFPAKRFTIAGAPSGVLDLANIIPVPANPGVDLTPWLAAVNMTESAKNMAITAAGEAQAAADRAELVPTTADALIVSIAADENSDLHQYNQETFFLREEGLPTDTAAVRGIVSGMLVSGSNVTITPTGTPAGSQLRISSTGGGSGTPSDDVSMGEYKIDATDFGVLGDGTTDNRAPLTSAVAAVKALAMAGKNVVLQIPSGVINITSVRSASYTDPQGTWLSNVLGIGLPVNIPGSIRIRGVGVDETIFKLSNNCRNLFFIDQAANYDVFRNIEMEDFTVDMSAVTSMARGHAVCGNRPYNNQFQKYLSFDNLGHRRIKIVGTLDDPTMATTSIIPFIYIGQQSGDWEAGVTPGSLPLKPFNKATAAADKWTYSLDIVYEDLEATHGTRGLTNTSVLVNSFTTHYVDRIRHTRCYLNKAQYTEATATALYCTGLGGFDGIIFEDCTVKNVGDDAIEIGGGQKYVITNFTAINDRLEGIYLRTWLMPLDPDNTSLDIDGYTHRITADAPTGLWPITNSGNRVIRGVPLQVDFTSKTNDDDANALPTQLASLTVRNMRTIIEGGKFNQIVRGGSTNARVGFHFDGHVKKAVFENCKAIFRNVEMVGTGDVIASMLNIRTVSFEPGVIPETTVRDFEAIFENVTSPGGGKFEVRGMEFGGNGDITIDGFQLNIKNVPTAAVSRAGIAYPGWGAGGAVRNLILKRLKGNVIGGFPTVRRGIVMMDEGTVGTLILDESDFTAFGANGDISWTPGIGPKTLLGDRNKYDLSPNNGKRIPTAASMTMKIQESVIAVTSTAAPRTITMPSIASVPVGRVYQVVDESNGAAANNITLAPAGTDTWLGGATSKAISVNGGSIWFYSNGSVWVPM